MLIAFLQAGSSEEISQVRSGILHASQAFPHVCKCRGKQCNDFMRTEPWFSSLQTWLVFNRNLIGHYSTIGKLPRHMLVSVCFHKPSAAHGLRVCFREYWHRKESKENDASPQSVQAWAPLGYPCYVKHRATLLRGFCKPCAKSVGCFGRLGLLLATALLGSVALLARSNTFLLLLQSFLHASPLKQIISYQSRSFCKRSKDVEAFRMLPRVWRGAMSLSLQNYRAGNKHRSTDRTGTAS